MKRPPFYLAACILFIGCGEDDPLSFKNSGGIIDGNQFRAEEIGVTATLPNGRSHRVDTSVSDQTAAFLTFAEETSNTAIAYLRVMDGDNTDIERTLASYAEVFEEIYDAIVILPTICTSMKAERTVTFDIEKNGIKDRLV